MWSNGGVAAAGREMNLDNESSVFVREGESECERERKRETRKGNEKLRRHTKEKYVRACVRA